MIVLRGYQRTGVNEVMAHWRNRTATNVCMVSPTGSGKTVMLEEIVHRARRASARVLWICHRDSLVRQAREELERRHAGQVGCISPDYRSEPYKAIQVATVQSALARGSRPNAQLVIADECHHYVADDWSRLLEYYRDVRTVGATATPERSDGKPLGSYFQAMVVAANYSQLIDEGHILPCRLIAPPKEMMGGIAQEPVRAYQQWGDGKSGFVFCGSVEQAKETTDAFNDAGITARLIINETDTDARAQALKALNNGGVKLLVNVYCLTEGVNVPRAKLCMLARGTGSVLTYLQMVGRVLRPFRDETQALLLDLHGSSLVHGFPTEDREFSLHGDTAIGRKDKVASLRQCLNCGHVWKSTAGPVCPQCGWKAPSQIKPVRIYNAELREMYRGDDTDPEMQQRELVRLKCVAATRGFSVGWVVREFRQLFKATKVPMDLFTPDEIDEYYDNLTKTAKKKGYARGWANGCFRSTFGTFYKRY
jgi:superfamily II DNA or RNA helicase